jgi:hypothetical protein
VVAHRCFALPRSSILCGCINFPGRQVNAVWGRYPTTATTACTMYIKKAWSALGLIDKISPAFELRNSGGCASSRQVIPAASPNASTANWPIESASISSQAGHRVPLAYLYVAPPGSWAGSTTVAVPRHCRQPPPGQSPAYTYLKQPWQPLQVLALSQPLFCLLLQPILIT